MNFSRSKICTVQFFTLPLHRHLVELYKSRARNGYQRKRLRLHITHKSSVEFQTNWCSDEIHGKGTQKYNSTKCFLKVE